MDDTPRPDRDVIAAYLDEVEGELDAVRRLVMPPPSRFAAFHLQQAAEKLIKAVRLHRGLFASKEHNLELLINELPDTRGWRKPGPTPEKLLEIAQAMARAPGTRCASASTT